MHGREGGENRKRSRHMWSVPSSTAVAAAVDSNGSSSNHFVKDGRKISIGDCALFKPAQDSPPFIGIIRTLTSDKESNLRLRVNWLYRPAEVTLGKGVALEAAPNEVFYSFHSDEIPAASLLHPCKVAFLRKSAELPPGLSSFVCRRVYDIANKCLWWLTDQDYIDDHQEEVDQLLDKTHIEMQATTQQQQGARSPKSANGSAATSPLKGSPDSMQNSSSNFSSQSKGKKRERGVQSSEPVKRERSAKTDGGDSGQFRSESTLKSEVFKITEKGGLVDSEGVERLVQLMQPEKSEKKIDLSGRCLLAGIIAATDKLDCLSQFVQLRGLPVLDEWLQEVHKGKIGDPGNIKDGDKSVEDFLLVLLRALDKLPVNLNALQMCNIGKSVNHLRSHKNSEIQKKARSLVDTWKKRVEAEININDAKSGSSQTVPWSGRSRHDGYHGGNRHSNGSDAAIRSSVTHHSSLKSASVKLVQGDSTLKSASGYQGGARSALSPTSSAANLKEGQSRMSTNGATSEPSQAAVKEEKSSSSSQSHTNSQCSSDQGKNIVFSGKEDAKSSTAASRRLHKLSGSGSKHRKSANGLQGAAASGLQREGAASRSTSMARVAGAERMSNNANVTDTSINEGNNHKLIVKIPNRGRGPVQSVVGASVEDFSCESSRASSPSRSEKHDQSDVSVMVKVEALQSNEVDGSSTAWPHRSSSGTRELENVAKVTYSSSRNEAKSKKALDSAFSSMNALVESCVKFSESNASMSAGDDAGMNLLASVAAREICTSGVVSPATSGRSSAAAENSSSGYNETKKQVLADDSVQQQCLSTDAPDADNHNVTEVSNSVDVEAKRKSDHGNSHQIEEGCSKSREKSEDQVGTAAPVDASRSGNGGTDIPSVKVSGAVTDGCHADPPAVSQSSNLMVEEEIKGESLIEEKKDIRNAALHTSSIVDGKDSVSRELKSLHVASKSEAVDADERSAMVSSSTHHELAADKSNEVKVEKTDGKDVVEHVGLIGNKKLDQENNPSPVSRQEEESGVLSADKNQKDSCMGKSVDDKEPYVNLSSNGAMQETICEVTSQEAEVNLSNKGSNVTDVEDVTKGDGASATRNASVSPEGGCDFGTKLGFDLNEGLSADDGKNGEPVDLGLSSCKDTVCSISSPQIPFSSLSCGPSASITVASAAKGAFVPPDDLLKNKKELGWKGSAATSAFRPAEPRKLMEMPLGSSKGSVPDATAGKQARPPLDIDLNVADERVLQDIGCQDSGEESNSKNNPMHELITTASLRCSGGLDLDLNKADESSDLGHSGQRVEVPTPLMKTSTASIFVNGEASGRRDFDLNNGPTTEELHHEQASSSQHARANISFQPPFGSRINGSVAGNCFAWYPPGTSYAVSMTPSSLPDTEAFSVGGVGSGSQHVMGGPNSSFTFNHDEYKGSVLPSTPAMPFHSTPFPYSVFPFGTGFRLPTSALPGGLSGYMDPAAAGGRISAIPSQSVGNAASVSFQYPQPYVVSRPIPDVANNNSVESTQKWGKQGLDLNCGPGGVDLAGRDESLPSVSRGLPAISSQSLTEEQARMYNMASGVLKRKEPEGGWSMDKLNFKSSSWR